MARSYRGAFASRSSLAHVSAGDNFRATTRCLDHPPQRGTPQCFFTFCLQSTRHQARRTGSSRDGNLRYGISFRNSGKDRDRKVVAGGDSRVPPSSVRTVHRHPEGKKSRLRPFSLAPFLRQMAREKQARTRDLRRDGPKDLLRVLLGSPSHFPAPMFSTAWASFWLTGLAGEPLLVRILTAAHSPPA